MKRLVLIYGLLGGLLIALLQWSKYRFLVLDYSLELYGALVALIFASVGIWLGLKFTRPKEAVIVREATVSGSPFVPDPRMIESLGLTPRELEILQLMATGLSNREIADKLYVSENTVKTHSSRVFDKLGARRRTQAVALGKEYRLIP